MTSKKNQLLKTIALFCFVGSFVSLLLFFCWWTWPHPILGKGGLFFPQRYQLPVERMSQSDPNWAEIKLGNSQEGESIAQSGCALTCASMELHFYGDNIDPARLNQFLNEHDGYEGNAWIKWEVACKYPPGGIDHIYENRPSYALIDWNLLQGNPVAARIHRQSGKTHFVVIVGKEGWDYLILDPAPAADQGAYQAKDLGVPFDAVRYYRLYR